MSPDALCRSGPGHCPRKSLYTITGAKFNKVSCRTLTISIKPESDDPTTFRIKNNINRWVAM